VLNSLGFKPGTNLVGSECSGPPGFKPGTYFWEASDQFTGIQTSDKFSGKRMLMQVHPDSNRGHICGKRVLNSLGFKPGTNLVASECSGPPGFNTETYFWEVSAQFTDIRTRDKFSGKRMLRSTRIQNPEHTCGKQVLNSLEFKPGTI